MGILIYIYMYTEYLYGSRQVLSNQDAPFIDVSCYFDWSLALPSLVVGV